MSPGQGLYLCAVAIATLVMTNTRASLCQVGEAQRSSFWVSITGRCCVMTFWQWQRAWGLPSGEVWGSQWGERDAGPIRTLNTQPHSRRRSMCPPKHSRPFGSLFRAWCLPASQRAALLWSPRWSRCWRRSMDPGSNLLRGWTPTRGQRATPSTLLAESLCVQTFPGSSGPFFSSPQAQSL